MDVMTIASLLQPDIAGSCSWACAEIAYHSIAAMGRLEAMYKVDGAITLSRSQTWEPGVAILALDLPDQSRMDLQRGVGGDQQMSAPTHTISWRSDEHLEQL